MENQTWMIYTGAITGVIGAITGTVGAVLGVISFRRAKEFKILDLRLELKRAETSLRSEINDLPSLLEKAKKSYTRLAAAEQRLNSGATEHWLKIWDVDSNEVKTIVDASHALDSDISKYSHANLENRIIIIHNLHDKISKITQKYAYSLAQDDIGRQELRADQRAITQAKLQGK
jgi:GTPase involved in cell partitioning and DNA repair